MFQEQQFRERLGRIVREIMMCLLVVEGVGESRYLSDLWWWEGV